MMCRILVAARLLKPLGNPPPHSVKYVAASELLELVKDRAWLVKVTNAVNQALARANSRKKNCPVNGLTRDFPDDDERCFLFVSLCC